MRFRSLLRPRRGLAWHCSTARIGPLPHSHLNIILIITPSWFIVIYDQHQITTKSNISPTAQNSEELSETFKALKDYVDLNLNICCNSIRACESQKLTRVQENIGERPSCFHYRPDWKWQDSIPLVLYSPFHFRSRQRVNNFSCISDLHDHLKNI